ncbi:MAG: RibD family protein [Granulosicoccus sp.]
METEGERESDSERQAWALLRCLSARMGSSKSDDNFALRYETSIGQIRPVGDDEESADIALDKQGRWVFGTHLDARAAEMLEFYLPFIGTPDDRQHVIAHLGQSLDAQIATASGDSFFVTGPENRKHLHRLRALCDAVIVGAGTVHADNPQLTTRAVIGENPVRVVIDPGIRLCQSAGVFTDEKAQTLVIHDERVTAPVCAETGSGGVVYLPLPFERNDGLPAGEIVRALQERGLFRLFIEGGGVSVSSFVRKGIVDRLQIAVAPLIVGAGRAALQMPAIDCMADALRPAYRVYRMGDDILWDFDLSDSAGSKTQSTVAASGGEPDRAPSFERLF